MSSLKERVVSGVTATNAGLTLAGALFVIVTLVTRGWMVYDGRYWGLGGAEFDKDGNIADGLRTNGTLVLALTVVALACCLVARFWASRSALYKLVGTLRPLVGLAAVASAAYFMSEMPRGDAHPGWAFPTYLFGATLVLLGAIWPVQSSE